MQQLLVFHPRGVVVLVSVLRAQTLCGQAFVNKSCTHHGFWLVHGFQAFGDVLSLHEVAHLPKLASRNTKYLEFFGQTINIGHAGFDDRAATARGEISPIIGGVHHRLSDSMHKTLSIKNILNINLLFVFEFKKFTKTRKFIIFK